jgi:hypothetical protein
LSAVKGHQAAVFLDIATISTLPIFNVKPRDLG